VHCTHPSWQGIFDSFTSQRRLPSFGVANVGPRRLARGHGSCSISGSRACHTQRLGQVNSCSGHLEESVRVQNAEFFTCWSLRERELGLLCVPTIYTLLQHTVSGEENNRVVCRSGYIITLLGEGYVLGSGGAFLASPALWRILSCSLGHHLSSQEASNMALSILQHLHEHTIVE